MAARLGDVRFARRFRTNLISLAVLFLFAFQSAFAQPKGGTVTSGSASSDLVGHLDLGGSYRFPFVDPDSKDNYLLASRPCPSP